MLPSMKTATPFRDFVQGFRDGYLEKVANREPPWQWAETSPCPLCKGKAYLHTTFTISALDDTLNPFAVNGEPIKLNDFIPCPKCGGTGVDFDNLGDAL